MSNSEKRKNIRGLAIEDLPSMLTLTEAADVFRVTRRTLYRWETDGRIKMVRPCGGWPLVPRSEVKRLLEVV